MLNETSPDDLAEKNLFSYLADAAMTGYIFKRLFKINGAIKKLSSEEVSLWRDHLPIWLTHVKKVIPYEAQKRERMVEEINNEKLSLAETPAVKKGVSKRERLESVINMLRGGQNYNPPLSGQYAAA